MRRPLLILAWLLSDGLVFVASYILAYFLRVGFFFSSDFLFIPYLQAAALSVPLWLLIMVTMRNYGLSRVQWSLRNLVYIAYACLLGMAAFTLVFYFTRQELFSRLLLLMAGGISTIAVYLWHTVFDQLQRLALRAGRPTYPALVIGTNREAQRLLHRLQQRRSTLKPIAILDARGSSLKEIHGVPVRGKLDRLEPVIAEHRVTHIIQCDHLEHSLNLLGICRQRGLHYMLLPFVLGVIEDHIPTEALEGQPVITVSRKPRLMWFFR
jgi:FlaA1/EpsC-like NDP-sugar epimerase